MDYGTIEHEGQQLTVDDELIRKITAVARASGRADKRWDVNLAEGKQSESALRELIHDDTIEVKRDFMVGRTGNLAIEFMCGGKPSGITTTQAAWWAFMLDGDGYHGEVITLIKKERLERLLAPSRIVRGGDRGKAEMFLLHVEELVKTLKGESK